MLEVRAVAPQKKATTYETCGHSRSGNNKCSNEVRDLRVDRAQ